MIRDTAARDILRRAILSGALLSLLVPAPALAQSSDLRDLLEHVPKRAIDAPGLVSYVDYRAVESARPGAARPASMDAWLALRDEGGPSFELWLAAVRGLSSGSGRFLEALMAGAELQQGLLGFDFFDVDRELHFGDPPGDGLVLAGTFDPQAIARAHVARGFTATQEPCWTRICGAAGCDQGTAIDLQAVERADPFGGSLGRHQPLLASDDVLLSSAALPTVEAMRAASEGGAPSLAEDTSARLALDAVPGDVLLLQATFVPSELLIADTAAIVAEAMRTGADIQAELDRFALEPIPPYRLLLLADTATADEQVVEVILAYASGEAAQAAAAVLPGRVAVARSIRADRTLRDLLDSRGVTEVSASVHQDPGGAGAAAVLTLRAPKASSDLSETPLEASSMLYRLLVDMILSRDAGWLAASTS